MGPLVIVGGLVLAVLVAKSAKPSGGGTFGTPGRTGPAGGRGDPKPPAGSKQTEPDRWRDYADGARAWWDLGRDVVSTFGGGSKQSDTTKPTGTGGT